MNLLELPEIDRKATRERLEGVFQNYRDCVQILDGMGLQPRVTGQLDDVGGGRPMGKISDPSGALVSREETLREIIHRVDRAVQALRHPENDIIRKRYLEPESEDRTDEEVWDMLALSRRDYQRRKARAQYKLAFSLKVDMIVMPEEECGIKM